MKTFCNKKKTGNIIPSLKTDESRDVFITKYKEKKTQNMDKIKTILKRLQQRNTLSIIHP